MVSDRDPVSQLYEVEQRLAAEVNLHRTAAELSERLARAASDQAINFHLKAADHYKSCGEPVAAAQQLRNAALLYTRGGEFKLAAPIWERSVALFEEGMDLLMAGRTAMEAAKGLPASVVGYSRLAVLYMHAKNHYGNAGMYDESADAYKKEMRCRRQLIWRELTDPLEKVGIAGRIGRLNRYLRYTFWDLSCEYGESLGRLLLVGVICIAAFAIGYWQWRGLGDNTLFTDALVYSASVFSTFTVGHFQLQDAPVWNFAAVAEAILGAAWQALLLSVLLRQLSRR